MKLPIKRTLIAAVIGALLAGGSGIFLYEFNIGQGLIHNSYATQIVGRGDIGATEAVVVFIDELSYKELDQPLNAAWDRRLHARLIDRLTAAGAKAIVFDVVFTDPNTNNPAVDQELARAMEASGRVVLGIDVVWIGAKSKMGMPPFDLLLDRMAAAGSVELAADHDLVVRHLYTQDKGLNLPTLAWATAEFLQAKPTQNPTFPHNDYWLNYYGAPGVLPSVSYHKALDASAVTDQFFRGKVVFVGSRLLTKFANERKDEYVHPFGYWLSQTLLGQRGTKFIAGVEIQATSFLNLVRGDWLTRGSRATERWIIAVFGLSCGFVLVYLRPILSTLTAAAVLVFALVIIQSIFLTKLIWFPWLIIAVQIGFALAWSIVFNSVQFYVQKRVYEHTLGLYLSPKLVKRFSRNSKLLKPGAEEHVITIVFTDIADFTNMSQQISTEQLATLMNNYFQVAVTKCIHPTDGTVVKYIGDAIFAFWNAPEEQPDHQVRACQAALHFRACEPPSVNGQPLRTRIGIHTGVARVGNFGSEDRVDYTALGESVNLASRLEGLNKYLGTETLISGDTKAGIGDKLVT
ncbi:MAG: adenylate/guanylate cyclase domain-containing protein, partial [Verrucomicrobia subdivision 3 bacterium]|nr:adenylate/guanylate cyclase domain-containing protein [Limisphaerales bacterium]